MMLDIIFDRQLKLQRESFGVNPADFTEEEKIQFIKDMILAATDELHEALGEVGWKPWATSKHINREAFVGELVDVFHFLVNLWLAVGATSEEVEIRYLAKANKNAKRQAEGYDGVWGKCPECKRAFDDAGVMCSVSEGCEYDDDFPKDCA
jgi:dimeric dUTPase (all-alpha-NTP-PPase superfamily)